MQRWMPRGVLWFSLAVIAVTGAQFGRHLWPRLPRQAPAAQPQPAPEPPPPPPTMAMFRGNPERNRSAIGTVPRHPKLLWRFRTRTKYEGEFEQRGSAKLSAGSPWSGLGWTGQPARVGERIYFGSSDSYVYCLNAATGQPVWYYPTHHCVKGSISVFGDRIYHGGRDNKIHCYTLDGKMVWETRTGNDMDSNPVVVGNRGFIGGEDKHIYCFDPGTGKILWQSETTDGSVESSPCVVENRVYAGSGHGLLYCLDAGTGKTIWRFRTLGDTDSTPVYADGAIYIGSATGDDNEQGHLWCVDAASGKARWHIPFRRGFWATAALNPEKGQLYIGCNNGIFYALKMTDGSLVWKRKLGNRIWGSAAVTDGCVVVGVRDGRVWCLEEDTGTPIWVFDEGFDIDATPCVADGAIIFGSQNGWVYAIGEAPAGEALNPHWFSTTFPMPRRLDQDPTGIVTVKNPAPKPGTYQDTSARCRINFHVPVYGAGHPTE
jgi:outer membrane protein assembly factor BamB